MTTTATLSPTKKERKRLYQIEYHKRLKTPMDSYARYTYMERKAMKEKLVNRTVSGKLEVRVCLFCREPYLFRDKIRVTAPTPLTYKDKFCSRPCQLEYFHIKRIIEEKLWIEEHERKAELKRLESLGHQYTFPDSFSEYNHALQLPKTNDWWRYKK